MADQMQPTPRGFISGLFSDVLGRTLNMPSMPRTGIPSLDLLYANRNSLFNVAGVGDVQKTAERISYGQPLTTGSGMTLRPREEAINAAMTIIPLVGQGSRVANQAAMTAGRAGARYAERVIPQVMERGGLPAQLLGDISRGSVSPLDVYHGTPHTLPPTERNPLGEFDASKIGTGEGAQAYGYGIYTAENPAVAKEYQFMEQNWFDTSKAKYKGKSIDTWYEQAQKDQERAFRTNNKALEKDATARLAYWENIMTHNHPENVLKQFTDPDYGWDAATNYAKSIDLTKFSGVPRSGNLYKVDLPDEKIAAMLDFDKPMAEQRNLIEKMRKALVGGDSPLSRVRQFEINDFLNDNVRLRNLRPQSIVNLNDPQIVKRLSEAGIPGIKYLDQFSREAGQGTRNFVTFPGSEKSMTILERNGMPATPIASPTYSDPFGNTIGSSIR